MAITPEPSMFRGLYDEHHRYVWALLRRLGVPEADADDLMQDVFIVVHRRWDDFEGRATIKTWLYGIATRVYWNYARRQRGRPSLAETSASSLPIVRDPATCPERAVEQQQAGAMLERLLGDLDPPKRIAYVLSELEGLSAPQISAMTGVNQRTIYSRVRAAKVQIAQSAKRVQAREVGDQTLRRLARTTTRQPPEGLTRRAWVGLLARLPASTGRVQPAFPQPAFPQPTLPWWGLAAAPLGAVAVVAVVVGLNRPDASDVAMAHGGGDAVGDVVGTRDTPEVRNAEPLEGRVAGGRVEEASLAAVRGAKGVDVESTREPKVRPAGKGVAASDEHVVRTPHEEPSDVQLLQAARAELRRGDVAKSLRTLEEHALLHPKSALAPERERTRLVVLCKLGRRDEAVTLAGTLAVGLPASCTQADGL